MSRALETRFRSILTRLNFDQPDIQPRVFVGSKGERAGDVNRANRRVGPKVISDPVTRANLHAGAGRRQFTILPGRGGRPYSISGRANEGKVLRISMKQVRKQD